MRVFGWLNGSAVVLKSGLGLETFFYCLGLVLDSLVFVLGLVSDSVIGLAKCSCWYVSNQSDLVNWFDPFTKKNRFK